MEYKIGGLYHGFNLKHIEHINEINSVARVFEHEKSGARLLHLENDDDNKVFSIGFRTPPQDSTGVAHIIEHSVLCGSRKFPTKEPFVELIKGSLNTFLNAMTFGDKTIYPLASKNEKDFFNLMDVYLDAVFYPNIYSQPEILMQEGWHYELENKEDDLKYKGVVYNEMKGAFSSPEGVLMRKIQETLFPDNTYGFESGGDPDYIPDLTQEEFLGFHTKYYHPSNSYILLYGDLDLNNALTFINDNYLRNFDLKTIESSIEVQKPYNEMKEFTEEYSISTEDSDKEKTFLALNFVTGKATDPEIHLALEIIEYLLLETQGAPLKKALLDAGIGKDVYGSFDNGILQPLFSVVVKNSEESKKEEFKNIVFDTLSNLVHKGIDKKLIEACINITEFKLREADLQGFPKGLFYYITAMDSWLYDQCPLIHLKYEDTIKKMKTALTSNYFEDLIKEYILNNNHSSLLVLKPKKGLAEEKEKALSEKLKKYKEGLSEESIEDIIKKTKSLMERQNTPDSEEVLETIPMLSLEDIDKKVENLEIIETMKNGVKVLHHETFTSKIAYISFMFKTEGIKQEDIPYISLLSNLLGKVDTKERNYIDLSNEILINTGGIYFKSEVYGDDKDVLKYHPFLQGHCKAVIDKVPRALELVGEIIKSTVFEDKKRIKEIVQMLKSRIEGRLIERGHIVASLRLASYFSPASLYLEHTVGYDYYKFLEDIEENYDDRIDGVISKLYEVMKTVFNKDNLIVTVTGEEEEYNVLKDNVDIILYSVNNNKISKEEYTFTEIPKNEGLLTPSNVQYVAKGYNFRRLGYEYSGKLLVLKTIMSLDYLWNRVRVQGGAYGGFANLVRSGNLAFVSYRDPNLKETLEAYDKVVNYIETFDTTDREMTKYIIGTISELDSPLTPSMKGEKAVSMYIRGITKEDRLREREEVLQTTTEDIKSFDQLLKDVMNKNFFAVLGNDAKIKENKNIFNSLQSVFK
ncbi:insulinase family protein [Clostridium sp. UBA4548]|uniref:insulinase family protein n=1 Tax=Clostridium sp. UBA4548 TaxID=1946361 RepID=UPI0025C50FAC|nr:insulinase family protein [Clostridium sp. UBA4548]